MDDRCSSEEIKSFKECADSASGLCSIYWRSTVEELLSFCGYLAL